MRAWAVLSPLSTRLARSTSFAATREARAAALRASAVQSGAPRALPCEAWPSDAAGAPAVVRGWHASWTDTTGLVAALVAPFPVALDAEWRLRPRWHAARELFRASGELERLGDERREAVLELWCAKEALLKLARVGLADLGRCPLVEVRRVEVQRADERTVFRLRHREREHDVHVHRVGQHLLACASPEMSSADFELTLLELQEVA